ncbi:hypothetical protein GWI33_019238 [Rhynchophorus ferrugineus]|uniref:Uncharacterized protein n=1 Tax=Rhynchophorus ferrugineus TaxID=354439 RepID=A0A834HV45_RHYFE|nr:hypothetical protein GWI33_019238 [Rhynchophorus ferrugineus]
MEEPLVSYESGNSTFYISTKIPIPVSTVQDSAVAELRTFSKTEINGNHRTSNIRTSGPKITFEELHFSYGQPILKYFNIWKRQPNKQGQTNA